MGIPTAPTATTLPPRPLNIGAPGEIARGLSRARPSLSLGIACALARSGVQLGLFICREFESFTHAGEARERRFLAISKSLARQRR